MKEFQCPECFRRRTTADQIAMVFCHGCLCKMIRAEDKYKEVDNDQQVSEGCKT